MKRIFVRISIVAIALLLGAVGLEVFIRFADPFGVSYYRDVNRYTHEAIRLTSATPLDPADTERLFQNKPGVDLALATFRYCTDKFGFRSAEPGGVPSDRGMRVLCIGDSTTLGWGVDDDSTWIRFLEREALATDGRQLNCLNAGHLMYDTSQEADLLSTLGPSVAPEIVLVMFNTNDLTPTIEAYQGLVASMQSTVVETGIAETWTEGKRAISRQFRGVRALLRYREEARTAGRVARHDFSLSDIENYPGGWPRVAAAFDRIRTACEAMGATLVVLDHADPLVPEMEPWCEMNNVHWIDARWTNEEWGQDIRNSKADSHANAEGNRLIAEKVARGLREFGLLRAAE